MSGCIGEGGQSWEGGGGAHGLHIDDWLTGCLQCTEIIPLAAQFAWT